LSRFHNRKGVCTYVLSFPGGPTAVATYLRAGWSLGNTQQRYIHEGDGSDQLAGRVACGLPLNNLDFTYLPPHFQDFVVPEGYFEAEFASYESFPRCFRLVLPYLVASLVYHREWIQNTLPLHHPYRNSLLFRSDRLNQWATNVVCGRESRIQTNMACTGIPPTLIISQEVDEVRYRVEEVKRIMEDKDVRLHEYLEELATRLPSNVGQHILNRFEVNGAMPITIDDLRRSHDEMLNRVMGLLDERFRGDVRVNEMNPIVHDEVEPPLQNEEFQVWHYGGAFHRVPEDFELISLSTKLMWDYWHFGDLRRRICPFRRFRQSDLRQADQKKIIKARRVMRAIELRAFIDNIWPSDQSIQSLGIVVANQIFQDGFDKLLSDIENQRRRRNLRVMEARRDGEIHFVTIYNDMALLN